MCHFVLVFVFLFLSVIIYLKKNKNNVFFMTYSQLILMN